MDRRTARLNEQLKREISQILDRKVRDPRVGRILVTEARVTADLWMARVFFRPLSEEHSVEEIRTGLEAASPFIRRELGKVLHIRRIPELRFRHDTTLDSAARIEAVLSEVLPEGGAEDAQEGVGAPGGEGEGVPGFEVGKGDEGGGDPPTGGER